VIFFIAGVRTRTSSPRVRQVMKQTRARVFGGDPQVEGKLLSLFEPSTEIIRKGKAAKPNEFGKMVKLSPDPESPRLGILSEGRLAVV
jgi:hypothetical protein